MKNVVAVLCSRLKSSRLPNKVMLPIAGRPALWHCLTRLQKIGIPVILAVPSSELEAYVEFIDSYPEFKDIAIYSGEDESPLHRTVEAVKACYPWSDYIIRATHDDPLIDPEAAKSLLAACVASQAGYGTVKGLVEGGGVEVIDRANLEWAAERHQENGEFISYYVKSPEAPNPTRKYIHSPIEVSRPYRFTMDYLEDWWLLDSVMSELGPEADLATVCRYIDRNPELAAVNRLPTVSFYTCAKNAREFVGETIRSVLNSTRLECEYVILDDGSDDGTKLEILKWVGRLGRPPFVKFISHSENKGLATRSNEAVSTARGKYVMRVDADDTLIPGSVDGMVELAEATGADVVYAHYAEVDKEGIPIKPRDTNSARHAGCALMRRSFIYEARFRDGIMLGDSRELWERAEKWAKVEIHPQVSWNYRKWDGSLTAKAVEHKIPPMGLR